MENDYSVFKKKLNSKPAFNRIKTAYVVKKVSTH